MVESKTRVYLKEDPSKPAETNNTSPNSKAISVDHMDDMTTKEEVTNAHKDTPTPSQTLSISGSFSFTGPDMESVVEMLLWYSGLLVETDMSGDGLDETMVRKKQTKKLHQLTSYPTH